MMPISSLATQPCSADKSFCSEIDNYLPSYPTMAKRKQTSHNPRCHHTPNQRAPNQNLDAVDVLTNPTGNPNVDPPVADPTAAPIPEANASPGITPPVRPTGVVLSSPIDNLPILTSQLWRRCFCLWWNEGRSDWCWMWMLEKMLWLRIPLQACREIAIMEMMMRQTMHQMHRTKKTTKILTIWQWR